MDEEVGLTADEVLEQATSYWLVATNGESTLVCVKVNDKAGAILDCAHHMGECAREAVKVVFE